jgi:phosphopantetheinyl transferase
MHVKDLKDHPVDLSPEFQEKYQNLLTAKGQAIFKCSYYLKCQLAEWLKLDPFEISYGPSGKPYLTSNGITYNFNIAHHDNIVVLFYHLNKPVGIDLLNLTKIHLSRFECPYFSKEESLFVNSKERFCHIWLMKEAYAKYLGTGLTEDLTNINLLPFLTCKNGDGRFKVKIDFINLLEEAEEGKYILCIVT